MSSLAMTALNLSMRGAIAGALIGGVLFSLAGGATRGSLSKKDFRGIGIVAGLVNGAAIGAIRAVWGQKADLGVCIGFLFMAEKSFEKDRRDEWGGLFIRNTLFGVSVGGLLGVLITPIFLK